MSATKLTTQQEQLLERIDMGVLKSNALGYFIEGCSDKVNYETGRALYRRKLISVINKEERHTNIYGITLLGKEYLSKLKKS